MKAFVNVHVNGGKDGGREVAAKYGVHAYPTLVVVDEKGGEIDRIVGYRPPDKFIPEVERILRGEGTLPTLKKKIADFPNDSEGYVAYAEKLTNSDPLGSVALLTSMPETAKPVDAAAAARQLLVLGKSHLAVAGTRFATVDRNDKAAIEKAVAISKEDRTHAFDVFQRVATEFGATPSAAEAVQQGGTLALGLDPDHAADFYAKAKAAAPTAKDKTKIDAMTYTLHLQLAAKALRAQAEGAGDDAQALNQICWTFYEHKTDMPFRQLFPLVVTWAKKAVELSKRDPQILDTYACLLAATGKYDDAIAAEQEALGKAEDGNKGDFTKNIEEWTKVRDAMKARNATPTTPVQPSK